MLINFAQLINIEALPFTKKEDNTLYSIEISFEELQKKEIIQRLLDLGIDYFLTLNITDVDVKDVHQFQALSPLLSLSFSLNYFKPNDTPFLAIKTNSNDYIVQTKEYLHDLFIKQGYQDLHFLSINNNQYKLANSSSFTINSNIDEQIQQLFSDFSIQMINSFLLIETPINDFDEVKAILKKEESQFANLNKELYTSYIEIQRLKGNLLSTETALTSTKEKLTNANTYLELLREDATYTVNWYKKEIENIKNWYHKEYDDIPYILKKVGKVWGKLKQFLKGKNS